jgi:hypothetical protein
MAREFTGDPHLKPIDIELALIAPFEHPMRNVGEVQRCMQMLRAGMVAPPTGLADSAHEVPIPRCRRDAPRLRSADLWTQTYLRRDIP